MAVRGVLLGTTRFSTAEAQRPLRAQGESLCVLGVSAVFASLYALAYASPRLTNAMQTSASRKNPGVAKKIEA